MQIINPHLFHIEGGLKREKGGLEHVARQCGRWGSPGRPIPKHLFPLRDYTHRETWYRIIYSGQRAGVREAERERERERERQRQRQRQRDREKKKWRSGGWP